MKLKGLTKLALSGVALAAVAATLGTSTYAWYVSNSKAEVSSISGTSKSTASGSLLINKLAISSSSVVADTTAWTNKIAATDLGVINSPELQPVTRDGNYDPDEKTGWHLVDGSSVQAANVKNYVGYFLIGVKTTDASKLKVNMTWGIQNDTVTPNAQTAYKVTATNGVPSGVTAGTTFYEDFVCALKFDWHLELLDGTTGVADYVVNGVEGTGANADKIVPYTAYSADSFKGLSLATPYAEANGDTDNPAPVYKTGFTAAKRDGNAHEYYRSISEDNVSSGAIIGGETESSVAFTGTANTQFTLPDAENEYVLVVRYWLDGADAQCFDSCIGQTFTMNMKFESQANNA